MEPLIDELIKAWEEGVWTYDRATKTNFRMYVWYHYSLHDLPAYDIFLRVVYSWKVPMPNMQGNSAVHLVEKGGQVFVV